MPSPRDGLVAKPRAQDVSSSYPRGVDVGLVLGRHITAPAA
jgi:hypothetical protein